MKKNHNNFVALSKYFNFLKENKIWAAVIIIFLLTIRWNCGNDNETGKVRFDFGCSPVRISDVKEIIK
jgi:hypothetical protein